MTSKETIHAILQGNPVDKIAVSVPYSFLYYEDPVPFLAFDITQA